MITIHKYAINFNGLTSVHTNAGAEILTVQLQNGLPYVWLLVETDNPPVPMSFWTYGTGQEQSVLGRYIATFQAEGYVGHVFHV